MLFNRVKKPMGRFGTDSERIADAAEKQLSRDNHCSWRDSGDRLRCYGGGLPVNSVATGRGAELEDRSDRRRSGTARGWGLARALVDCLQRSSSHFARRTRTEADTRPTLR